MNKLLSRSCLAALACLAACSSMAPYPGRAIEDDAEQTTNVVVSSTRLHRDLRFGRASVKRVEGTNQLKVIVPIRNVSEDRLQVRVQVSFTDLEKLPIGDETNFQVALIGAGETYSHSVTSTSSQARDWILRVVPNN